MMRSGDRRIAAFTDRHGFGRAVGRSAPPFDAFNLGVGVPDDPGSVQGNRSRLAAELGVDQAHLVFMNQVHGCTVTEVTGPTSGAVPRTDAMVCAASDIALAVLVADCVPVLAADWSAGVIGAAHAGRLGAAAGIVPALVARMVDLGAAVERMEVLLGPAICGRCYEVPQEMRADVDTRLPGSACVTSDGTPGLDLRAGIVRQLRELGVGTVAVDNRCTREDPDLFSHRR